MGTMFLQEVDATIVLADVRDFSPLTQQLNPIDLNLTLSRFCVLLETLIPDSVKMPGAE